MLDDLRAAVSNGLHVDNAWAIVRLCNTILKNGDLENPIAVLSIQAVVARRAADQDGVPVDADRADAIDAILGPAINQVIQMASGRQLGLLKALNALAEAHARTLKM